MWVVGELQLAGNIGLRSLIYDWNPITFMLHEGIDDEPRSNLPFHLRTGVGLGSSTGQKCIAGFHLAKSQCQGVDGRKVIAAPGLVGSRISTRGTAEENAFIRVGIVVLVIEVEEIRPEVDRGQHLGGCSFRPQIEFAEARQMRNIKTWTDCRTTRIGERQRVIVAVHIAIHRQPIPQAGNSVGEIKS